MKVEVIDWPPTVIVDGKVVYQEEPVVDLATGEDRTTLPNRVQLDDPTDRTPSVPTYAVADVVPESSDFYLTAGKKYRVHSVDDFGFYAFSDSGQEFYASWDNSDHLHGANWRIVVETDQ